MSPDPVTWLPNLGYVGTKLTYFGFRDKQCSSHFYISSIGMARLVKLLYLQVMELDLPYDKMKQQRRAFCFITFDNEDMAEKACWDPKQMISGKEVRKLQIK